MAPKPRKVTTTGCCQGSETGDQGGGGGYFRLRTDQFGWCFEILNFVALLRRNPVRIRNNLHGFPLIDIHQNKTLSNSFQGHRLRVIGNHCNFLVIQSVSL